MIEENQQESWNSSAESSQPSFWSRDCAFRSGFATVLAIAGFIGGCAKLAPIGVESGIAKSSTFAKYKNIRQEADATLQIAQRKANDRKRDADDGFEELERNLRAEDNANRLLWKQRTDQLQIEDQNDQNAWKQKLASKRKLLSEMGAVASAETRTTVPQKTAHDEYIEFMKWLGKKRPDDYAAITSSRETAQALGERLTLRRNELEKTGSKVSSDAVFKELEKKKRETEKELADRTTAMENSYFDAETAACVARIEDDMSGTDAVPGLSKRAVRAKAGADRLYADAQKQLGTL